METKLKKSIEDGEEKLRKQLEKKLIDGRQRLYNWRKTGDSKVENPINQTENILKKYFPKS